MVEQKQKIQNVIQGFEPTNLEKSALNFFASLGYSSEIQLGYDKEDIIATFKERYNSNTSRILDRVLYQTWDEVIFLFQYTKNEVLQMNDMFTGKKYNPEEYESYIFCAIRLNENNFSNTKLANITREINRLFMAPVMILFSYGEFLTLSIINRRPNNQDFDKDVVDKVALIKDISIHCPHRAHI